MFETIFIATPCFKEKRKRKMQTKSKTWGWQRGWIVGSLARHSSWSLSSSGLVEILSQMMRRIEEDTSSLGRLPFEVSWSRLPSPLETLRLEIVVPLRARGSTEGSLPLQMF